MSSRSSRSSRSSTNAAKDDNENHLKTQKSAPISANLEHSKKKTPVHGMVKQGGLKLKMKSTSQKGPPTFSKHRNVPKSMTLCNKNHNKNSLMSDDKDDNKRTFRSLQEKIDFMTTQTSTDMNTKASSIHENENDDEFDSNDPLDDAILENDELFNMSDTLLAIRSLIQHDAAGYFPAMVNNHDEDGNMIIGTTSSHDRFPFVLRQMIHRVLLSKSNIRTNNNNNQPQYDNHAESATVVMEEITTLQRQNKVRLLKLPILPITSSSKRSTSRSQTSIIPQEEDIAIIETHTYIQAIQQATRIYTQQQSTENSLLRSSSSSSSSSTLLASRLPSIVQTFISLLSTETRMSISHSKLLQSFPSFHIDILIQKRFLTPVSQYDTYHTATTGADSSTTKSYHFTLPTMGKTVRQINNGRKNILQRLRLSYRKEIPRKVLLERGMNYHTVSFLSMAFHLRDLISLGKVTCMERPSGTFVKLVEHG